MNVVFDTNVLISSTLWDGSAAQKLLFKLILSDVQIFTSTEILQEYSRVLKRDFAYTDDEVVGLLEKILSFVKLVEPAEKVRIVEADPDDNKIIECALASASKYVVTYDSDLLEIKEFRGVRMLKPEELLRIY